MKHQPQWIFVILCVFASLFSMVTPQSVFALNQRYPNKDEESVCSPIRDVIRRNSGRFRKVLIRSTNVRVSYLNDDARHMSSRAKSKLDVLATLVTNEWNGIVTLFVFEAWTDVVRPNDPRSLHYEGRSVRLGLSDRDPNKLGRLAGLAKMAGFDWIEYTDSTYIRASVIPDVCQTSVDLVFLLDGSYSVTEENFVKVKDFVKRVVDFFNIGVDGTHVAVVTFDTHTYEEFNLMRHFTKSELRNAVDRVVYRGALTYTAEALDYVRDKIFTVSAGMRTDPGIPKVLVLLTDGNSNGKHVGPSAASLRARGVNIFSIGVGSYVSVEQLNAIASDPDTKYVFQLSSFNDLANFVDTISGISCSEGSLINSCETAETSVESGSFKYFRTTFDVVNEDEVSVEVRDLAGLSFLFVSVTNRNPGPLDESSIKNTDINSPRAVSVRVTETKTVFVAVQGQQNNNKFRLSFWDNLFQNHTYHVDIKEGLAPQEVIELTTVQHPYSLEYNISDGNTDKAFTIATSSPKLSTSQVLDYETKTQYNLVIVGEDQNNKCRRSRTSVQVNVMDINDNAPRFQLNIYSTSIAENAATSTLIEKVVASDSDSGVNGEITYSITSGDPSNVFEINSGGEVTLKGSLDFEVKDFYTLTITAKDNGSPRLNDTAELRITVRNVNEQPTISCPGNCIYSVSEAAPPNTPIGSVTAKDPDTKENCALQYSIDSAFAANKFTVASNGVITTKGGLDRETTPQYTFYIKVSDCGTPKLTASVLVTVRVDDANDNKPQFPGPYNVDIPENESPGSTVVQVTATDADEGINAEIRYALLNGDHSNFSIDAVDGTIKTLVNLDYETKRVYKFNVTAADQGPGDSYSITQVTVNVNDVNDNPPSFVGTPYVASVKEDATRGTAVINVNTTDDDSGLAGEVRYSIASGNLGLAFLIDEDTGVISVNTLLDQETRSSYNLIVQATDKGSPSMNSQVPVSITVGDTNDNAPVFRNLPYTATVPEDFRTGQPIIKVTATDDDMGKFGEITYSIESPSNARDTFYVDGDGNIRLNVSLDYETEKNYVITVVATDGGGRWTKASVTITVGDVNDNVPRFEQNPYTATIRENLIPVQDVETVKANDADSGQRGLVTYTIVDGNAGASFTINAEGNVIALVPLDRETREFYNLTIRASDSGSPPASSTTQMEITVLDENDNTPSFGGASYSFTIPENNSPNSEVATFGPATDRDKGLNGEIVYTIVSGDPDNAFEYEDSGKLVAKKVLNRETTASYSLVIRAQDKGSPPLSSSVSVRVVVDDTNDNGPTFSKDPYNCEIDENSLPNSRVCFVFASDSDAGANGVVTYELVTPSSEFSVDENTGKITALKTLDRETKASYTFDVSAKDGGQPSRISNVTVIVTVLDKNDNEPEFNQTSYSFDVSEDAGVDTIVGQVFAEDKDEGLSGEVIYTMTGGNTGSAFSIDSGTGIVMVRSKLDRETIASYRLTVRAADRGTPSLASSRVVLITVKDVNDNDPIFTQDPYNGKIAEDASTGSAVIQVKATDADDGVNGAITYSISNGDRKDDFSINEDSGLIITATKLDFESKKSYSLTVTATDGGTPPKSSAAVVNIAVENTNDNAPTFVPGTDSVNVSEGVAIRTPLVKFNATDKDGNSLVFLIRSGNTGGAFEIDRDSGLLTTNATLDRETVWKYNLTVTVTEKVGGSQSPSQNLVISVTDENDNAPRFTPSAYSVNVTENTVTGSLVTVNATDDDEGDNAKITFSIDAASSSKFTIDPDSGEISSRSPLDYEQSPRYVITVTAKDSGNPSLSSTATVEVKVQDLNDNNPNFAGDYATSLRENTAAGRAVIRVEATDPDDSLNGEIEYNIASGDEGFFTIGKTDGVISIAKSPDRETYPSFTLIVTARNKIPADPSVSPIAKTSATVKITIDDVNDNAPIIINNVTSVEIAENSRVGFKVIDVNATDSDMGANSEIKLEIVDGNIDDVFKIDEQTGLITVKGSIDRETRESYTLKVRASDKGSPSLSSEKDFTINVTDVNDNIPMFSSKTYEASVNETAKVNTFVIHVLATDADAGANGKITFSIVSLDYPNHFRIDPESGRIFTNALLDFETVPSYTLRVRAEDPSNGTETGVSIRVININDNSPVFNPAYYAANIPEDQKKDVDFLRLMATDKDAFGGLTYSIVGGNINSRFTLNPASGGLQVTADLDRESTDFYNLTVQVTDGGSPRRSDTSFVEITITDVNDNAPKFNESLKRISVRENSPTGMPVLTVLATDSDSGVNGLVQYHITLGNESSSFALNEDSGLLTVNGHIDREMISSFRLVIVARDRGSPSLSSTPLDVRIEVLDDNDNSPKFTKESYQRNISETVSVGSFVEEVEATDEDIGLNGQVVYALAQNGAGVFEIDNNTGVITTLVGLDRETVSSYVITVIATDLGNPSRSSSAILTVNVLDANDHSPVFDMDSLYANVTEEKPSGEFVTRVVATDDDFGTNAEIEYKLSSNGNQFLEIDSQSGVVRTRRVFDFELQRNYTFKVTASDKGNPSLSTTDTLHVDILDTDDNCPVFNPKEYNVTVEENQPIHLAIVRVYARDVDTVSEERLTYGIRSGNLGDTFTVNQTAGIIKAKRFVDRELSAEYNLIVRAGNEFCGVNATEAEAEKFKAQISTAIAKVNVFVTDVNDNPPIFSKNSYGEVLRDISTNELFNLTAEDPDAGMNAEFDFALEGVSRDGNKWTLTVVAKDKGDPPLSSNATVEVTGENCGAMAFRVSPRGLITVKTLCYFDKVELSGKELVGENITLHCNAKGNTVPEYTWSHNGVELTESSTLFLNSITKRDSGLYTCKAASDAGNILKTIKLDIKEPARILVPPKDTWAQIGLNVTLSCLATGDEPIRYSWLKNGQFAASSPELDFDSAKVLFKKVVKGDEGSYKCLAQNEFGSSKSQAARLHVFNEAAVIEMKMTVDNPLASEQCQSFDMKNVIDNINQVLGGSVGILEFDQPPELCNLTVCSSNPCENQGICLVQGSDFLCSCQPGWEGRRCEVDKNECQRCIGSNCTSSAVCSNGGVCENRKGSFFCNCPQGNSGKLCEFKNETCHPNPCRNNNVSKNCFETDGGFKCYGDLVNVSMVYELDSNRRPFEEWMLLDIAKEVEIELTSGDRETRTQGKRKRRAVTTTDPLKLGSCSVRVLDHVPMGTTLQLTIVVVCDPGPSKTYVCNALLAKGKVRSCVGNDGKQLLPKPKATMKPTNVSLVLVTRDEKGQDNDAVEAIRRLEQGDIRDRLKKYGMTGIELRARVVPKAPRQESDDGLSAAAIIGIILGVIVVILVAVAVAFVLLRTRKSRDRGLSIRGRSILAPVSKKHERLKRDISLHDLKHAEVRDMNNKAYTNHEDDQVDVEDGSFMVNLTNLSEEQVFDLEYMKELENADWFHGSISRIEAEQILNSKDTEGSFLVRQGLGDGEFYISARTAEDYPKFRHIAVNRYKDSFVAICGPELEATQFSTFNELIDYLRSTPTRFEGSTLEFLLKDKIERKKSENSDSVDYFG